MSASWPWSPLKIRLWAAASPAGTASRISATASSPGASFVENTVAAVTSTDANRAAQRVLATDAIPASPAAGAALHAAAQLIATGTSRSALAIFSGRQALSF